MDDETQHFCNKCFNGTSNGAELYLTDCGHIVCQNCASQVTPNTCPVCGSVTRIHVRTKDCPLSMKHYFQNLEELSRNLASSAAFQLSQKNLLLIHLQSALAEQVQARHEAEDTIFAAETLKQEHEKLIQRAAFLESRLSELESDRASVRPSESPAQCHSFDSGISSNSKGHPRTDTPNTAFHMYQPRVANQIPLRSSTAQSACGSGVRRPPSGTSQFKQPMPINHARMNRSQPKDIVSNRTNIDEARPLGLVAPGGHMSRSNNFRQQPRPHCGFQRRSTSQISSIPLSPASSRSQVRQSLNIPPKPTTSSYFESSTRKKPATSSKFLPSFSSTCTRQVAPNNSNMPKERWSQSSHIATPLRGSNPESGAGVSSMRPNFGRFKYNPEHTRSKLKQSRTGKLF